LLSLRPIFDVSRQLFNLFRFFHQIQAQNLARIRLVDLLL